MFITQSWDTGFKAGTGHDASACLTFFYSSPLRPSGLRDGTALRAAAPADAVYGSPLRPSGMERGEGKRHYLVHALVVRAEYPELRKAVMLQAARWKPDAIVIEDRGSGQSLIQDLKRETALPVIAASPRGDKVQRLLAVSAMLEAGLLALPHDAPWLAAFEAELFGFPDCAHDDQVDALTQYLGWMRAREAGAMNIRGL